MVRVIEDYCTDNARLILILHDFANIVIMLKTATNKGKRKTNNNLLIYNP